jgi:hypothetical protein
VSSPGDTRVYHLVIHCTVKLPFPLTLGFKSMLQRGIETPDMDVRWVSSLSWYFLNFFGLNGLYRLILGSDNCKLHIPSGNWLSDLLSCFKFIPRYGVSICGRRRPSATGANVGLKQTVRCRARKPSIRAWAVFLVWR